MDYNNYDFDQQQMQQQPEMMPQYPQEEPQGDDLTEEDLQIIYNWVDEIPLSRPKRSIARDFSDGVLVAEIIKHFIPKIVDMHNYSAAHSVSQKTYNWNTLNVKVLKKLNLNLSKDEIEGVVNMTPDAIEKILLALKVQIEFKLNNKQSQQRANSNMGGRENRFQQNPAGVPQKAHNQGGGQLVDPEVLLEKDHTIGQMRETIEILELKIKKLEQLVKLKDSKIANLSGKLQSMGIM